MKLFISYSRDDKHFVYELAHVLNEEAQYDVWIDRRLTGAELWWDTILNSIEVCDCFVVILTPLSVNSIYCKAELDFALALKKPILPLVLKDCEIPHLLHQIHQISIGSLSLTEILVKSMQALHRLEMIMHDKPWQIPTPTPARPNLPQPQPGISDHVYEVFSAAEDAYQDGNLSLAKDLYQNVILADPTRLGYKATERLGELKTRGDMIRAYEAILKMFHGKRLDTAEILWENYTQQYGATYDPEQLKDLFYKPASNPIQLPIPPIAHPTTQPANSSLVETSVALFPPQLEGRMQLIPKGMFTFGKESRRYLDDFYLDIYPVTNQTYLNYVQAAKVPPPTTWRMGRFPTDKAQHPVTGITFHEAVEYAHWIGARLPSAEEWEKAARGIYGFLFPWGNQFDMGACNSIFSHINSTTPVNAHPHGISPFGIYDLIGNVWEWTTTQIPPRGITKENSCLIKGGSFRSPETTLYALESSSCTASLSQDDIGFRCAWG